MSHVSRKYQGSRVNQQKLEVPNTEVTWGEYFFDVPLNEWQAYDVAAFE